ncbi:MAG TPA: YkgJ family cysteine cluster protein [Cyclobacteriaceae bacterium]|nr:YkgJ family cysteine cluster protein [Cyclobacteriaceae bacterium]
MLEEKVKAVEGVFRGLDEAIFALQRGTSLHCKFGCGKCCLKPDIEASVLEFLPFAFHLYHTGKADDWYEMCKSSDSSICLILNPTLPGSGHCSEYPYRGLICRLFGYSARTNKYGVKELVTCQIIKTEQTVAYQKAELEIEKGGAVPVMSDYYMQLHAIDPDLSREFYPINQSIRRALECVLQYYAYR